MAAGKSQKEPQAEPGHVEDIQATEMLREDHRKVKEIFDEFERTEDSAAKKRLVERALVDLTVHAKLEEEVFYPTVRREIRDDDLMDEAAEEHHVAKLLIGELASMKPSDPRYDAKFLVLAESVRHHIEEEEGEMLPKIEESGFDLETLGQEMTERKLLLVDEVTLETIRDEAPREVEGIVSTVSGARRRAHGRSGGARGGSSRRVGGRSRSRAKASR
jgi:hemerythrin superfamily protein